MSQSENTADQQLTRPGDGTRSAPPGNTDLACDGPDALKCDPIPCEYRRAVGRVLRGLLRAHKMRQNRQPPRPQTNTQRVTTSY